MTASRVAMTCRAILDAAVKFSKVQMRRGELLCFLCGERGADTVEHVVPQCLYPGPLGEPVQAPAHRACNATTTKQEESFRNLLAASAATPAESPLFDKMLRSLDRPQAKGMRADFQKRMRPLPDGSGIIGIPDGHSTWVLAKIVKGLAFLELGAILRPSAVRWVARRISAENFAKIDPAPTQYRTEIPPVLEAAWSRIMPEVPAHAYLRFYGKVIFGVTALPATRHFAIREWGALMLAWPR